MFSRALRRQSIKFNNISNVRCFAASLEGFGDHLFKGSVAAPYLAKHGLSKDTIEIGKWPSDGTADKVAAAVLDWAKDNNASVYCHWFQPLGASGLRHGQSGQVQNRFL